MFERSQQENITSLQQQYNYNHQRHQHHHHHHHQRYQQHQSNNININNKNYKSNKQDHPKNDSIYDKQEAMNDNSMNLAVSSKELNNTNTAARSLFNNNSNNNDSFNRQLLDHQQDYSDFILSGEDDEFNDDNLLNSNQDGDDFKYNNEDNHNDVVMGDINTDRLRANLGDFKMSNRRKNYTSSNNNNNNNNNKNNNNKNDHSENSEDILADPDEDDNDDDENYENDENDDINDYMDDDVIISNPKSNSKSTNKRKSSLNSITMTKKYLKPTPTTTTTFANHQQALPHVQTTSRMGVTNNNNKNNNKTNRTKPNNTPSVYQKQNSLPVNVGTNNSSAASANSNLFNNSGKSSSSLLYSPNLSAPSSSINQSSSTNDQNFFTLTLNRAKIESVSENVYSFLKFPQDEMIGNSIFSYIHPNDTNKFNNLFKSCATNGQSNNNNNIKIKPFQCQMLIKQHQQKLLNINNNNNNINNANNLLKNYETMLVSLAPKTHHSDNNNNNYIILNIKNFKSNHTKSSPVTAQQNTSLLTPTTATSSSSSSSTTATQPAMSNENTNSNYNYMDQFNTKMTRQGRILSVDSYNLKNTSSLSTSSSSSAGLLIDILNGKSIKLFDYVHSNDLNHIHKHIKDVCAKGKDTSAIYRLKVSEKYAFVHTNSKLEKSDPNSVSDDSVSLSSSSSSTNEFDIIVSTHSIIKEIDNDVEMKGNASTSLMKTLCNKKPPVASSIYKSNSSSITTPLSVQTNSLSGQGQYESSNTQKKNHKSASSSFSSAALDDPNGQQQLISPTIIAQISSSSSNSSSLSSSPVLNRQTPPLNQQPPIGTKFALTMLGLNANQYKLDKNLYEKVQRLTESTSSSLSSITDLNIISESCNINDSGISLSTDDSLSVASINKSHSASSSSSTTSSNMSPSNINKSISPVTSTFNNNNNNHNSNILNIKEENDDDENEDDLKILSVNNKKKLKTENVNDVNKFNTKEGLNSTRKNSVLLKKLLSEGGGLTNQSPGLSRQMSAVDYKSPVSPFLMSKVKEENILMSELESSPIMDSSKIKKELKDEFSESGLGSLNNRYKSKEDIILRALLNTNDMEMQTLQLESVFELPNNNPNSNTNGAFNQSSSFGLNSELEKGKNNQNKPPFMDKKSNVSGKPSAKTNNKQQIQQQLSTEKQPRNVKRKNSNTIVKNNDGLKMNTKIDPDVESPGISSKQSINRNSPVSQLKSSLSNSYSNIDFDSNESPSSSTSQLKQILCKTEPDIVNDDIKLIESKPSNSVQFQQHWQQPQQQQPQYLSSSSSSSSSSASSSSSLSPASNNNMVNMPYNYNNTSTPQSQMFMNLTNNLLDDFHIGNIGSSNQSSSAQSSDTFKNSSIDENNNVSWANNESNVQFMSDNVSNPVKQSEKGVNALSSNIDSVDFPVNDDDMLNQLEQLEQVFNTQNTDFGSDVDPLIINTMSNNNSLVNNISPNTSSNMNMLPVSMNNTPMLTSPQIQQHKKPSYFGNPNNSSGNDIIVHPISNQQVNSPLLTGNTQMNIMEPKSMSDINMNKASNNYTSYANSPGQLPIQSPHQQMSKPPSVAPPQQHTHQNDLLIKNTQPVSINPANNNSATVKNDYPLKDDDITKQKRIEAISKHLKTDLIESFKSCIGTSMKNPILNDSAQNSSFEEPNMMMRSQFNHSQQHQHPQSLQFNSRNMMRLNNENDHLLLNNPDNNVPNLTIEPPHTPTFPGQFNQGPQNTGPPSHPPMAPSLPIQPHQQPQQPHLQSSMVSQRLRTYSGNNNMIPNHHQSHHQNHPPHMLDDDIMQHQSPMNPQVSQPYYNQQHVPMNQPPYQQQNSNPSSGNQNQVRKKLQDYLQRNAAANTTTTSSTHPSIQHQQQMINLNTNSINQVPPPNVAIVPPVVNNNNNPNFQHSPTGYQARKPMVGSNDMMYQPPPTPQSQQQMMYNQQQNKHMYQSQNSSSMMHLPHQTQPSITSHQPSPSITPTTTTTTVTVTTQHYNSSSSSSVPYQAKQYPPQQPPGMMVNSPAPYIYENFSQSSPIMIGSDNNDEQFKPALLNKQRSSNDVKKHITKRNILQPKQHQSPLPQEMFVNNDFSFNPTPSSTSPSSNVINNNNNNQIPVYLNNANNPNLNTNSQIPPFNPSQIPATQQPHPPHLHSAQQQLQQTPLQQQLNQPIISQSPPVLNNSNYQNYSSPSSSTTNIHQQPPSVNTINQPYYSSGNSMQQSAPPPPISQPGQTFNNNNNNQNPSYQNQYNKFAPTQPVQQMPIQTAPMIQPQLPPQQPMNRNMSVNNPMGIMNPNDTFIGLDSSNNNTNTPTFNLDDDFDVNFITSDPSNDIILTQPVSNTPSTTIANTKPIVDDPIQFDSPSSCQFIQTDDVTTNQQFNNYQNTYQPQQPANPPQQSTTYPVNSVTSTSSSYYRQSQFQQGPQMNQTQQNMYPQQQQQQQQPPLPPPPQQQMYTNNLQQVRIEQSHMQQQQQQHSQMYQQSTIGNPQIINNYNTNININNNHNGNNGMNNIGLVYEEQRGGSTLLQHLLLD